MPIYEFICDQCRKKFEELIFNSYDIQHVCCPYCHTQEIKRTMSVFGFTSGNTSSYSTGSSCSSCCSKNCATCK